MSMSGMSPVLIEAAGRELRAQGNELRTIRGRINGLVAEASIHWEGSDLRAFRATWQQTYQERIRSAALLLDEMADELARQAVDQRRTSEASFFGNMSEAGPFPSPTPGPSPVPPPQTNPSKTKDYEEIESEIREKLAEQLSAAGFSAEEQERAIAQIAQQLDSTPEPWKSLYLRNLAKLDIVHDPGIDTDGWWPFDNDSTNYYSSSSDTAVVNFNEEVDDPRGPYNTLWHELAHGVDDKEKWLGWETTGYNINGRDLDDALRADVQASIEEEVKAFTSDSEQQRRVVGSLMAGLTFHLPQEDQAVVAELAAYYDSNILHGADANVASDIFGAMTHNVLGGPGNGTYGHEDSYWDSAGNNASKEFWAGYSANQVIGGDGLQTTQDLFPEGHKFADQMAQEIAQ